MTSVSAIPEAVGRQKRAASRAHLYGLTVLQWVSFGLAGFAGTAQVLGFLLGRDFDAVTEVEMRFFILGGLAIGFLLRQIRQLDRRIAQLEALSGANIGTGVD
jgi:hypothetical protein